MKRDINEHIAALIERIGRLLYADAHANGLLPVQWEVLRYLDRANRFSRTPAALTAYLGLTKGTVSQTLSTLETKGLVKKQVNPQDRRSRQLALSAKGRKLLGRDPLIKTLSAIDSLTQSRRDELANGLETVLSQRLATQRRQPFGQCRDCRYFTHEHAEGRPYFCQLLDEPLTENESYAICYEQRPAA